MTHVKALVTDGVILVRHQIGDPIADVPQKRFGPKGDDVTGVCLACGNLFEKGDFSVLIPLGPGGDEEAQEKARAGRWFNAVAVEIHDTCSGGIFDD